MIQITAHFAAEEFACKSGDAYPLDNVEIENPPQLLDADKLTWRWTRLQPLCETLEVIRAAVGKSIIVDSGYRTLAYDQKLYDADHGAGNVAKPQGSQHPKGRAADIRCPSLTPTQLHNIIISLFFGSKLPHLGGVGIYSSFCHVDVRPRPGALGACDGHLARWAGTRASNVA